MWNVIYRRIEQETLRAANVYVLLLINLLNILHYLQK